MKKKKTSKTIVFFRRLFARKPVMLGAALVVIFVFCAIFAPILTKYGYNDQNLTNLLAKPSAEHLFGTDLVGRDVLTRIFFGARTSLLIGLVSVLFAAVCGVALGLLAGFFKGILSSIILRITDAMMTIPAIMLALALSLAFKGGITALMIVLGISTVPVYVRMMYAQTLSVRNSDYVSAQKVLGASNWRIMITDILPNCVSPIIVMITQNIGGTILAEASLSFLGFGVIPPMASWGAMVNEGYPKIMNNPVFALAPGICIMLLVLGFNLLGDGLRDTLDPRLRGTF